MVRKVGTLLLYVLSLRSDTLFQLINQLFLVKLQMVVEIERDSTCGISMIL